MLSTCAGAKPGDSSITTRPDARSRYSVLAGSSARQSAGWVASRISCIDFGFAAAVSVLGDAGLCAADFCAAVFVAGFLAAGLAAWAPKARPSRAGSRMTRLKRMETPRRGDAQRFQLDARRSRAWPGRTKRR